MFHEDLHVCYHKIYDSYQYILPDVSVHIELQKSENRMTDDCALLYTAKCGVFFKPRITVHAITELRHNTRGDVVCKTDTIYSHLIAVTLREFLSDISLNDALPGTLRDGGAILCPDMKFVSYCMYKY